MIDDELLDEKTISDSGLSAEQLLDETPRPSLVVLTGMDAGRIHRLDLSLIHI